MIALTTEVDRNCVKAKNNQCTYFVLTAQFASPPSEWINFWEAAGVCAVLLLPRWSARSFALRAEVLKLI